MTVVTGVDMYDSTVPEHIPPDSLYVAGYMDGAWPWMRTRPTLFPKAKKLDIAVFASTRAKCLDVEKGNATPQQAPGWAKNQRALGEDPWVYCSRLSTYGWQAVQDAFNAQHVAHPWYFVADYTTPRGTLMVLNGHVAIAHQYADFGPLDASALTDTAIELLGGTMTAPTPAENAAAVRQMLIDWRDADGRNFIDQGTQGVRNSFGALAAIADLTGALSADEAALLGAIRSGNADLATAITKVQTGQPITPDEVSTITAALVAALPSYNVTITPSK